MPIQLEHALTVPLVKRSSKQKTSQQLIKELETTPHYDEFLDEVADLSDIELRLAEHR